MLQGNGSPKRSDSAGDAVTKLSDGSKEGDRDSQRGAERSSWWERTGGGTENFALFRGPSLRAGDPRSPQLRMLPKAHYTICVTAAAEPPEGTWGGGPVIWARLLVQVQGEDSFPNSPPSLLGFHCRNSSSALNALLFFELGPP